MGSRMFSIHGAHKVRKSRKISHRYRNVRYVLATKVPSV